MQDTGGRHRHAEQRAVFVQRSGLIVRARIVRYGRRSTWLFYCSKISRYQGCRSALAQLNSELQSRLILNPKPGVTPSWKRIQDEVGVSGSVESARLGARRAPLQPTANLTICGNIKNFPVEALALLVLCQGPSHSVTMYVTATVARGCILDRAWHRNLVRRIRLHPPAQIEGDEAGV